MVFDTKEIAVTTFINEIKAPNSELANIKDTLEIYCTGQFDHKTGIIHPFLFRKKYLLLKGLEVKLQEVKLPDSLLSPTWSDSSEQETTPFNTKKETL